MARTKTVVLLIGLVMLLYGTAAVFIALDQNSHSASDTLRPFVITMAPVWFVAVAGARAWLRPMSGA